MKMSLIEKRIDELNGELDKLVNESISPTNIKETTDVACLILKLTELMEKGPMLEERPMYSNAGRIIPQMSMTGNAYGYSDGMVVKPFRNSMGYPMMGGSYAMGYPEQYMPSMNPYNDSMNMSKHSIGDRAVDALERLMDKATTEFEREELKSYIKAIRREQM